MSSLTADVRAQKVIITDERLSVELNDGRSISVPLAWYPRLSHSSPEERNSWRLIGSGEGIHWPSLDEDISIDNLLAGKRSGESQESFNRWLQKRTTVPSNPALS
jgi:hypothetical protein